jgi:hypothetical protein
MSTTAEPHVSIKDARDQLDLVLGFFPRVDAKASVVLAINTGMLAVLASNASPWGTMPVGSIIAASLSLLMLAGSFWFLYKVAFPTLSGGQQSLIYFREIANRTESRFIDEFIAQDESAMLRDILGQVWRNSEILKMKFDALRWAFVLMALAIVPWVASVSILSAHNSGARSLLMR